MRVVNMTATFHLGCELDIIVVASALPNSKYDPKRFSGIRLTLKHNQKKDVVKPRKFSALIFRTGSVVLVGNRSAAEAKRSAAQVLLELANIGFFGDIVGLTISNKVIVHDFEHRINLEKLSKTYPCICSLEYEIFNALFVTLPSDNGKRKKATVFRNGKVHITGVKIDEDNINVLNEISFIKSFFT